MFINDSYLSYGPSRCPGASGYTWICWVNFFLPAICVWFGFDSSGADYVYTPFSVKEAKAHTKAGPGSRVGGPTFSLRWSEQDSRVGVLRHMLSVLLHSRQMVHVQLGPQLSPSFGHCLRERSQMCGRNNYYQGIDQESVNSFIP